MGLSTVRGFLKANSFAQLFRWGCKFTGRFVLFKTRTMIFPTIVVEGRETEEGSLGILEVVLVSLRVFLNSLLAQIFKELDRLGV